MSLQLLSRSLALSSKLCDQESWAIGSIEGVTQQKSLVCLATSRARASSLSKGIASFGRQEWSCRMDTVLPRFGGFQGRHQLRPMVNFYRDGFITSSGGGGIGAGGNIGGTGGGGGGGNDGEGDEIGKKSGLTNSQLATLIYGLILFAGGITGYVKTGSTASLAAGLGSAGSLAWVFYLLPNEPRTGSSVGLVISGVLLVVLGLRWMNTKKFIPAGITSLLSLFMTVGYVHGIHRSS